MNALGITYLVLSGVAGVFSLVHLAQAVVIRSDKSQGLLAVMCMAFSGLDLGIALSSQATGAQVPAWVGWSLLAGTSAAVLTIVVPMAAWVLLEVKVNRARQAIIVLCVVLGLERLGGVIYVSSIEPGASWERIHTLRYAWLAFPSISAAIIGAGTWAVEGLLAWKRNTAYGGPMALFGLSATLASAQGLGVTLGLLPPPDLFGLMALPAMSFVQVLSSVRFVRAFQTANQPAGDMARYEVLRKLGAGGMGDIFLARRRGPAGFLREVVLKQLQASADATGKERFLAEARLAAQLQHPNIVDVYDLGTQPEGFFIVMEHITGFTLSEIIKRSTELARPIPPEAVAELGLQICRGLSFAHGAQVIHRDIKRQNIMVSEAGVLKLIDFGIAQEAPRALPERRTSVDGVPEAGAALTAADGVIGTFGYIAPERYQGFAASVATDLFSVGVVLYELLALAAPFRARNQVAFVEEVGGRAAPKLESIRADASRGLVTAIESCLEPSPQNRPQSATQLQVLLEHVLGGRRFELGPWVTALFSGAPPPRQVASPPTTPAQKEDLPTADMKRPASV